jgi:hypothetical protein
MAAMPAEQWTPTHHQTMDHEIAEQTYLDLLIDKVAYYQELAFEYPTTMVYRRLLEDAQRNLKEAERNYLHASR